MLRDIWKTIWNMRSCSVKTCRLLAMLSVLIVLGGCGQEPQQENQSEQAVAPGIETSGCVPTVIVNPDSIEIAPGLNSRTVTEGCGDVAQKGHIAIVHYTGWLYDESAAENRGTKFDSSRDRDQHFKFPLGAGRVKIGRASCRERV